MKRLFVFLCLLMLVAPMVHALETVDVQEVNASVATVTVVSSQEPQTDEITSQVQETGVDEEVSVLVNESSAGQAGTTDSCLSDCLKAGGRPIVCKLKCAKRPRPINARVVRPRITQEITAVSPSTDCLAKCKKEGIATARCRIICTARSGAEQVAATSTGTTSGRARVVNPCVRDCMQEGNARAECVKKCIPKTVMTTGASVSVAPRYGCLKSCLSQNVSKDECVEQCAPAQELVSVCVENCLSSGADKDACVEKCGSIQAPAKQKVNERELCYKRCIAGGRSKEVCDRVCYQTQKTECYDECIDAGLKPRECQIKCSRAIVDLCLVKCKKEGNSQDVCDNKCKKEIKNVCMDTCINENKTDDFCKRKCFAEVKSSCYDECMDRCVEVNKTRILMPLTANTATSASETAIARVLPVSCEDRCKRTCFSGVKKTCVDECKEKGMNASECARKCYTLLDKGCVEVCLDLGGNGDSCKLRCSAELRSSCVSDCIKEGRSPLRCKARCFGNVIESCSENCTSTDCASECKEQAQDVCLTECMKLGNDMSMCKKQCGMEEAEHEYNEVVTRVTPRRAELVKCAAEGCEKASELKMIGKEFLLKTAEKVLYHIQTAEEMVSNASINETLKQQLLEKLSKREAYMQDLISQVNSSENFSQFSEIARKVKNAWKVDKYVMLRHTYAVHYAKLLRLVDKMKILNEKLNATLNALQASGYDTSALKSVYERFMTHKSKARESIDSLRDALDNMKLIAKDELSADDIKELENYAKQVRESAREARSELITANEMLFSVIQTLKMVTAASAANATG